MALSPELIQKFDQITGFKTPTSTGPTKMSRAEELREIARQAQLKAPKSFLEKGTESLNKRADKVGDILKAQREGKQSIFETAAQTFGQGLGAAGDVGLDAASSLYNKLPEGFKSKLSGMGKEGLSTFMESENILGIKNRDLLEKGMQSYDSLDDRTKRNLEAAFNILTSIPTLKGAEVGTKLAKEGVEATFDATKKAVTTGLEKRAARIAEREAQNVNRLVGTIAQGKIDDIPKIKRALSSINIDDINTYDDLYKVLDEKVAGISTKLDEVLSKDKTARSLDDFIVKMKVGDKTIGHNYIEDAFNQLEELYNKINDPAGLENIRQIRQKANSIGLTVVDVNNLAKLHGREFSSKAFSKVGEPLTSVNAQSFENTRKGLKDSARGVFKNPIYEAADEEITNLIRTRDLVDSVAENVNKLKQKVSERGWGEKAGRLAFKVADKLTGGGLKGFVQSFIPRGDGLKVMNALDLEKNLQKNLKKLKEIVDSDLPEGDIIKLLEEVLQSTPEQVKLPAPSSPYPKVKIETPIKPPKKLDTNVERDERIMRNRSKNR